MSKERLEKAKKILNHIKGYGVYDGNDDIEIFEWLIEQAELNEKYRKQITDMNKTISEQRKQIKGKVENINKKQRYINFLKYGRYEK